MALVEPNDPTMFKAKSYEPALNQLIHTLVDSLQNPNPNFPAFTPTFLELIQSKPNPPPETIWFFSALTFQTNNPAKNDLLDQLSALKVLFQSITALSASRSSSIFISLLAPVVFKLHRVIVNLKGEDLISKREKREIRSFLDSILGDFGLCCCEGSIVDENSGFVRPLIDLVSIWVCGEGIGGAGGREKLRLFFPVLSDGVVDWVNEEFSEETLAGAVILEAFLLRLCLKFDEGSPKDELKNELRTWIACSITGFRNFYFLDMLIKMLLEPTLAVTALLSSEEELFLRKLLYDAIILADYSFLRPEKIRPLPRNHVKNNILARLMVTHKAVELFRKNRDHGKAATYTNAFSGSCLPSLLVQLVTSELGPEKASQPNGSSPAAFLKWVLDVEDQGTRLSDDFISKHCPRLVNDGPMSNPDRSYTKTDTDHDLLFFIDNEGNPGDEKVVGSMNKAFVAAARVMQSDSGKKRRVTSNGKVKNGNKFRRVDFVDRSGSKTCQKTEFSDGSASEVEDPELSDNDSE